MKKVHKQSSLTPALQLFVLVNQCNLGSEQTVAGRESHKSSNNFPSCLCKLCRHSLVLIPLTGTLVYIHHTRISLASQPSHVSAVQRWGTGRGNWGRSLLRPFLIQRASSPCVSLEICLHFHSPAGNKEEHDIYHLILPWLHPTTAEV